MKKAGKGIAAGLAASARSKAAATPLKLGIDLFSIRSQGFTAFQHLDYAAKLGVQMAHFSEPRFLGSLDEPHLRKVKAHADRLGLAIEVGMGSICPTSKRFVAADGTAEEQLVRMFGVARILGSPIVRCFLGASVDRASPPGVEAHIESTAKVCRAVRSRALDAGLKIAIENHAGDLQAREMKTLIEEAGRDYVGSCLDSGNPVWTIEDPHLTLETLAPYVLTTHLRDSALWEEPRGIAVHWTAMGEGNIGIDRWVARFAELCPGKPLSLEIIVTRQPRFFNYLDPVFWDTFRSTPAWEFARFLRLARQGSPHQPVQPPPGPDSKAFLVAEERRDLERSVAWCKRS
jgi:sugar phosphate isomerase/epimerase